MLEIEIWPQDVVDQLIALAARISSTDLTLDQRREVLEGFIEVVRPDLGDVAQSLVGHVFADLDQVALAPAQVVDVAIAAGTPYLVFAAAVDGQHRLWWTPLGENGPMRWSIVPARVRLRLVRGATVLGLDENRAFREIFGVTEEGRLWHTWCLNGLTWEEDVAEDAWENDNVSPRNAIALDYASGGPEHHEIFVVDEAGQLWHRWWSRWWSDDEARWRQTWSDWMGMPGPSGAAALRDVAFRPEWPVAGEPWRYHLFLLDENGAVWHQRFVGESGVWWQEAIEVTPPPRLVTRLDVQTLNPAGVLELTAFEPNGTTWRTHSEDRGVSWSSWQHVPDDDTTAPRAYGLERDERTGAILGGHVMHGSEWSRWTH